MLLVLGGAGALAAAAAGGYFVAEGGHAEEAGHAEGEAGHAEGEAGHAEGEEGGEAKGEAAKTVEGEVVADAAQVKASGIVVAPVQLGVGGGEVSASGVLVPATQAVGHVTARSPGVITRIVRQVGDRVSAGDPLAILDSREVAEAQAAVARTQRAAELARTVFVREEQLYRQRVTARAEYDQARAAYDSARIDAQMASQAAQALGAGGGGSLRLSTLRAPVSGMVTSVTVTPGEYVAPERELFQVADPRQVWAELRIPARDLERVRVGQRVTLALQGSDRQSNAVIRFLAPAVDPTTGAAKAIAVVDNSDGALRVGQNVAARIGTPSGATQVTVVPRSAIQKFEGKDVVFVRTARGFIARPVTLGVGSDTAVPVLSGLKAGEQIASTNSFVLLADLGKSEAEHAH